MESGRAPIDPERYLAFLQTELPRLAKAPLYPKYWPFPMRKAAVLDAALDRFALGSGIGLEFGVYKGGTLRRAANRFKDRVFHGFDSFEGLPADGRLDWKLDFATAGLPRMPANCKLWRGWFSETLPAFLASDQSAIGYVHIDCDIYSSAREVLFGLIGRLSPGTVITFDELLNYDTFLWNEMLALFEFLEVTGFGVEWIAMHRKVRQADEAIALLAADDYPPWTQDVKNGFQRPAALVLTPKPMQSAALSSSSEKTSQTLVDQFIAVSQGRTSLVFSPTSARSGL
jgi:hypothetical protein